MMAIIGFVASFLIGPVGLILWLVWKDQ